MKRDPRQGELVDEPGAQELLGGAADAVEQQVEVCEGEIAAIPSLQDIGGVLNVQLAGHCVVARAAGEVWQG